MSSTAVTAPASRAATAATQLAALPTLAPPSAAAAAPSAVAPAAPSNGVLTSEPRSAVSSAQAAQMEAARREAQARRAVLLREERQERAERARLARVARERQQERLLLAKLDAELGALDAGAARMQRTIPRVKSNLEESVRDLGQFRGVLQKAIAEFGADASGLHPFVKTAQRYAGTPYVWGGESRTGFDCSGFIIRVMRDLGYKALPHSAAEQFNYGAAIARGVLKPGDLVFFKNTYKRGISHVGIYLGRNRFIHAAGTGKGTIVSDLNDSPYAEKYAGARRLLQVRR